MQGEPGVKGDMSCLLVEAAQGKGGGGVHSPEAQSQVTGLLGA